MVEIRQRLAQGPDPLRPEDSDHLVKWIFKMIARIESGGLEGNYRRCWLQTDLLEIYFQMRRLWFLGPKKSFKYLKQHDQAAYNLFSTMYENNNNLEMLKEVAQYVTHV
ncbi:hypothetical protein CEDIAZO_01069 [Celerinatantimonas diazotrophica]|nr:hypothetical protein CEDIAZO_01069 [Celerinatantimonas diazotrophica]